jgi:hypothetical protein
MRATCCEIAQADVRPGLAGVCGFVYAVALGDVRTHVRLAAADVEDFRIGRRKRERADRADALAIEDRLPGTAGIAGLPHAAVDRTEIEMPRVPGDTGGGEHAAGAERPDRAPVQVLEQARVDVGRSAGGSAEQATANRFSNPWTAPDRQFGRAGGAADRNDSGS